MKFLFADDPYVTRDTEFSKPTWNQVFDTLSESIPNGTPFTTVDNYGLAALGAEKIPEVKVIFDAIQEQYPSSEIDAHVYLSLFSKSKTFGRHNDDVHVFFWQVYGQTRWIVEGSQKIATTLHPGDIIYIPRGQYHNTKPLGPRFGISFGVYYE
jgi:hypothetical protein